MKYVTYWYQFFTRCEEFVPIFHSVNLRKVNFAVQQSLYVVGLFTHLKQSYFFYVRCSEMVKKRL